ncbi:hypothetical protein AYK25_01015 [Thermoplasmatales archaeon SM1-50]|nr:MAG: hypothetical protein AYK25_01015 [Thermoplasmatales archaeon SM1-50]
MLMVRERKKRIKDIEKLHKLIDSASLPKQKAPLLYEEEKLKILRERLSDSSLKDHKQIFSSDLLQTKPDSLKPRVVIRNKDEIQRKDEKVIRIDLPPQEIKKEKEPSFKKLTPFKENPFSQEQVFEIEKIPAYTEKKFVNKPLEESNKLKLGKKSLLAISAQKGKEKNLQKSHPVITKKVFMEASEEREEKPTITYSQKMHSAKETQISSSSFSQDLKDTIPEFEPVEFTAIEREWKASTPSSDEIMHEKDRKRKKIEKLAKKDASRKEQGIKQLDKEVKLAQAIDKSEEKERGKQPFIKDQKEKPKLGFLERSALHKAELKRKKEEAKQVRLQLKQKKREVKSLAKEYDKKQKLEWLEFQQAQKKNQKTKIYEEEKTIALGQQNEHDGQRLLKQHKDKLRLTQIAMLKKEKEERKKQELKTKQDAEEAREKELEEQIQLEQRERQKEKEQQEISQLKKESIDPLSYKKKTSEDQRKISSTAQLKQEQKEKERQECLKKKEEKTHNKLEEKQQKKLFGEKKEKKEKLKKQKKLEEKLARQKEKEKEWKAKRLLKEEQKKKRHISLLNDKLSKETEKQEQKLKKLNEKNDRINISKLRIGNAQETGEIQQRKNSEQQKNTMELVRIAAEEKELRKAKAFERKMEKERKKKEREEQKLKNKEHDLEKKKMDLHLKELTIKQRPKKQPDHSSPFVAFDSIDQETAVLLCNVGYTSVEKLRQATINDLVRIGVKKKNAQRIITECEEFVEWEAFDAIDHF